MSMTETRNPIDHEKAEAGMAGFRYVTPEDGFKHGKAMALLARSDILKGVVQVLREGGENTLHYHTTMDSFWMVLKGRVRFYGVGDTLLGEFGPHEGIITPRGARYWFERAGEEELELLQVAAYIAPNAGPGRELAGGAPGPSRDWAP
jgi:mannose-6-phosphate isomerase-like protein (cupin superfamily)